jgi:hypothetical protein
VVQVRDGAGHDLAVPGVEVTVALTGGAGQLNGTTTIVTDADGRAAFNDLSITGASGSRRLIFAADGYRSVTSNKIDVQKASTSTTVSANPEPSDPNQPVTMTVSVTSTTPGTPTGTVLVKATDSEQCTVSLPATTCQITFVGTGDRSVTATYSGDGTFAGSTGTAIHHVNEPPPPPVNNPPTASFTHADCTAGTDCQFTDTSTDPDGNQTIVSWSWDFGDFITSTEQNPLHTYIVGAGFTYHVTLTVTDDKGATSSATQDVTVP